MALIHPAPRAVMPVAPKVPTTAPRLPAAPRPAPAVHEPGPVPHLPSVGRRVRLIALLMALPLVYLWWSYGRVEMKLPAGAAVPAATAERGRLLLGELVLAETVGGKRRYPQGTLAGQLIGFQGSDRGLEGIEYFQEAELAAGSDVRLTLDPVFQAAAEAGLERAVLENEAQAGSVVALEAGTGRVLAVASYPRFNPNSWGDYGPGLWWNRAFQAQYEPGSTVKALVASALINEGLATPDSRLDTPMARYVGKIRVGDAVEHPRDLDLASILGYSSNVGISTLAERMSSQRLYDYLSAFGIGKPVALQGVSVARGRLRDVRDWGDIGRVTASFGQGFSTTTLGLAAAFSVLANDGLLIPPVLVEGSAAAAPRRVVSEEAARTTRRMLSAIVEERLRRSAAIPGYCLGGKTGTAQVAVDGRYSDSLYSGIFAGFFPCEKPRVTMVVEVFGGKKQYYGSLVAAPAFRAITEEVLANWGLLPTSPEVGTRAPGQSGRALGGAR